MAVYFNKPYESLLLANCNLTAMLLAVASSRAQTKIAIAS